MPEFNVYKIIGFDLRQAPIVDLGGPKKLGEYWPTDGEPKAPYPATMYRRTWPVSAETKAIDHPERNGLHLLWLPDALILDCDAVSVAFTMRNADAELFDKKSWVSLMDEGFLNESSGWRCLGFDIMDFYLGYSGFYGFTWKPGELTQMFEGVDLVFNRCGLIDDEALAICASEIFTQNPGTKSHAPFYPVRVWVQSKP